MKGVPYQKTKFMLVILHILALFATILGLLLVYCNENFKSGLLSLNAEAYEESPIFLDQFNADVNMIFDYVRLQSVFETEGSLDLDNDVFSINIGPGEDRDYTMQDLIEYAKLHGYYIDENYQAKKVEGGLEVDTTNYLINYRSYIPGERLQEPGDAYMTFDALLEEALGQLADYYKSYQRLIVNPGNIKYSLDYNGEIYSNDIDLDRLKAYGYGSYAILASDSLAIENNLARVPSNMSLLAADLADTLGETYEIIIAVDTTYTAADAYYQGDISYTYQRDMYFYGTLLLGVGLFVMILTFIALVYYSGGEEMKQGILYRFDSLALEIHMFLCVISCIVLLFINERTSGNLVHVILPQRFWEFAEILLDYVIIYICILTTFFVILRGFKVGVLWKNSLCKHLLDSFLIYQIKNSYTKRNSLYFFGLLTVNIVLISVVIILIFIEKTLVSRLVIAVLVIVGIIFDLIMYNKFYQNAVEIDKIDIAIKHMAEGNTDYQLDILTFKGKEEEIARNLNNVSIGLNTAINEQVKSERLKADLITNVSHDIKTPLTSIINYIDLIKRENLENPTVVEYLKVLDLKSQHLKNLTEDLVEASKVSSGNISVDIQTLDLVEMIYQTNGEFEEKFLTKQLHIIATLASEPVQILADGRHLWRVLENLYNNAYKYATPASRVYVEVFKEEEKGIFIIKNVSENALNFNAQELTERFVRGDVSRATEGSGLGLSIAKSLTLVQEGTFSIDIDGDLFKVRLEFSLS